jgi:ParB family chromosome partitioning protein
MITKSQSTRTRHLGRGLEALLGQSQNQGQNQGNEDVVHADVHSVQDLESKSYVIDIPVGEITPNPYQARKHWDQEKLSELANSIKANGLVQPVLVRKVNNGYQLIAGERRYRACQLLGKTTIPSIVRHTSDLQQLEWSLVENIQRDDLNPIDRAKAYQAYVATFGLNQTEAASRLGEDRSVISNYLRLLDLPNELQQMLVEGKLSMGHARALLSLPTDELRRKLANRAMVGRLSVREIECQVRRFLNEEEPPVNIQRASHIEEMEKRIGSTLGTKVRIDLRRNGRQGKLVIDFRSLEDFDRILDKLGISSEE